MSISILRIPNSKVRCFFDFTELNYSQHPELHHPELHALGFVDDYLKIFTQPKRL